MLAYRFWRVNISQSDRALCQCSAGQSDTEAMVPWPVPWHQRLDNRRSPLGASQPKKNYKKTLHWRRQYHVFSESQYHSTMRSDAEPEKTLPSPSTIIRREVIQKNGVRKQDDIQSVHRPSIVTIRESTRHRDRDTVVQTETRTGCARVPQVSTVKCSQESITTKPVAMSTDGQPT